jgi:hypothetical protein
MSDNSLGNPRYSGRLNTRVHTVDKISVRYEGKTEQVADRLPDVSPQGMFINTNHRFPEGAVLNLSFRLALSGAEIQTRCEVRYCQPGVGVGVEFIGISDQAKEQIEREVELYRVGDLPKKRSPKKRRTKAHLKHEK